MTAAREVFLMMRVGYDFVAGFMMFAGQEFLEGDNTSDEERHLGEEEGLGSSECDDTQEERDQSGDLQLGESKEGEELLDLLLLATGCKEKKTVFKLCSESQYVSKYFIAKIAIRNLSKFNTI